MTRPARSGVLGAAIVAVLSTAVGVMAAQDHAPDAGSIVLQGLGPDTLPLREAVVARPVRHVLPNGLTTLIVEDRSVGLVTLRLSFSGAGALDEPEGLVGVAGITADLLLEATTSIPGNELVRRFQRLGATFSVNAPPGSTETVVEVTGLSRNLAEWFSLALDVVRNPAFPEPAFSALVALRVRGIEQQAGSLPFLLERAFYALLYPGHPASRRSASEESLAALSVESVRGWHADRYVPASATLTVVGDVEANELRGLIERESEGWVGQLPDSDLRPLPSLRAGRRIALVDRPGTIQAGVVIGNRTVSRGHPDYIPLRVANELLSSDSLLVVGADPAGRQTYVGYSQLVAGEFPGPWSLVAATGNDTVTATVNGLLGAIRRLQDGPVTAGELEDAKTRLITAFALSLEEAQSRAVYAGLSEAHQLEEAYWTDYIARVGEIGPDDIGRVARSYLDLDTIQIAVVGDGATIRPELEAFGPVELFGPDLEPIPD